MIYAEQRCKTVGIVDLVLVLLFIISQQLNKYNAILDLLNAKHVLCILAQPWSISI